MKSFISDNNAGVHPQIMESIIRANKEHAVGYGNDSWTREAEQLVKQTFETNFTPLFVFNGTGSNVIALQLGLHSFHAILCADTAHIFVDECGAPVKFTGAQLVPIKTKNGKLTVELIKPYVKRIGDYHHSQPKVIYISQTTELGTVYTKEELIELTEYAHRQNLYVHMDGARLANAAVSLGCSLKEITKECGIDSLSFGGTKNGLLFGECVVLFNEELAKNAGFYRKQAAQLASKMRFISCQFSELLTNRLWAQLASQANDMAKELAKELSNLGAEFTQKVESNQLFFTLPTHFHERFSDFVWNEEKGEFRLVTSFDTSLTDIRDFLEDIKKE